MRQLTPAEQIDLASLTYAIAHDPATRPDFARLVAKKFPDRARSFSDVSQQEQIAALRREWQQEKLTNEAKEFQRAQNRQRDALIKGGYTKEQVADIKQIMDSNGIVDYNIGAVLYAHDKQPLNGMGEPRRQQRPSSTFEFATVPGRDGKPLSFGDFVKNPTAAALDAAYQTISEFKARRPLAR